MDTDKSINVNIIIDEGENNMAMILDRPRQKKNIPKELQDKLNKITAKTKFVNSKNGIVQLNPNNLKDREWFEDDQGFEVLQ